MSKKLEKNKIFIKLFSERIFYYYIQQYIININLRNLSNFEKIIFKLFIRKIFYIKFNENSNISLKKSIFNILN